MSESHQIRPQPPNPSPNRSPSVRRARALPGNPASPCDQKPTGTGKIGGPLKLTGDVESLRDIFVTPRRRLVGTLAPESVIVVMKAHPGGVSEFYEQAIAAFDGNLPRLVEAAARFITARKQHAPTDVPQIVNGRIQVERFHRLQTILDALKGVRGMSRAKAIAGLIQLRLERPSASSTRH